MSGSDGKKPVVRRGKLSMSAGDTIQSTYDNMAECDELEL